MGPDGGNGGKGGDLKIIADSSVFDLYKFKKTKPFKSEDGMPGGKNNKSGRNGKTLALKVPTGTIIRDENEKIIKELNNHDEELSLKGGRGGRGNRSFASSVNRSPRKHTKGKAGEEGSFKMSYFIPCDTAIISNDILCLKVHEKLTGRKYENIMPNYPIIGVKVNKLKENEKILLIPNFNQEKNWLHHMKGAKNIVFIGSFENETFEEIQKKIPTKSKKYTYGSSKIPTLAKNIPEIKQWPN